LNSVYTLVLDLDETLVYYNFSSTLDQTYEDTDFYLVRPGVHNFISELSEYYEIVVFTAAMPNVSTILCFLKNKLQYADSILDSIDPLNKISHRLYR
jgi:CTD small phosphatase-like protein 2